MGGGLSDKNICKQNQIYIYGNVSACKKTNRSIHRISEYCQNWPNLAPILRVWHKKYLSGKSGGERNKIQALTLIPGRDVIALDQPTSLFSPWKETRMSP